MQKELMATIISVFPFEIRNRIPTIYPSEYLVPASKDNKPTKLIIGEAHHFFDRLDSPPMKVALFPYDLGRAIVEDWMAAQLGIDIENGILPGVTVVPGYQEEIEVKFIKEIGELIARQRLWFEALVKIADDDWERYHKHTAITHVQRHAAKVLKVERDWLFHTEEPAKLQICPACTSQVNAAAIICPTCKAVLDKKKFETLTFA